MSSSNNIQQLNRELADRLYAEARQNPQSPYAGKKIGFANGKVVVVADSWAEVLRELKKVEPEASKRFCLDTAVDYDEVQEIWETV